MSRPWRCEPCGYSTNINSNLRIHLSSEKHAIAVRKLDAVFLCGICTKFTTETAEQLEQHVNRWRHVDEEFGLSQQGEFFVCNLCNYKTQVSIFWGGYELGAKHKRDCSALSGLRHHIKR